MITTTQVTLINRLRKESRQTEIYLSKTSISVLTARALFTVTLNGGTVMDNLMNSSPVLIFARWYLNFINVGTAKFKISPT